MTPYNGVRPDPVQLASLTPFNLKSFFYVIKLKHGKQYVMINSI